VLAYAAARVPTRAGIVLVVGAFGAALLVLVLGHVVGVNFVIELSFLNGRERLAQHDLFSLITY